MRQKVEIGYAGKVLKILLQNSVSKHTSNFNKISYCWCMLGNWESQRIAKNKSICVSLIIERPSVNVNYVKLWNVVRKIRIPDYLTVLLQNL